MKLEQLMESQQQLAEFLKEHCGKICNEYKGANGLLFRGSRNLVTNDMYVGDRKVYADVITVRKDRRPRDSGLMIHNSIDAWFSDNFGLKPRSEGVFCTPDYMTAEFYGRVVVPFPIGDFEYVWSPKVKDLIDVIYPDADGESNGLVGGSKFALKYPDISIRDRIKLFTDETLPNLDYQTDNIQKAIQRSHEVVIICDKILYVDVAGGFDSTDLMNVVKSI